MPNCRSCGFLSMSVGACRGCHCVGWYSCSGPDMSTRRSTECTCQTGHCNRWSQRCCFHLTPGTRCCRLERRRHCSFCGRSTSTSQRFRHCCAARDSECVAAAGVGDNAAAAARAGAADCGAVAGAGATASAAAGLTYDALSTELD